MAVAATAATTLMRLLLRRGGRWGSRWLRGAVAEPGGEGGVDGVGVNTLEAPFLKVEVVDGTLEGGVGHEGDVGGGVAVVLTEAGGEGGEEVLIADAEPEVVKLIGDGLEMLTVGV
jgi:hypothetical protein